MPRMRLTLAELLDRLTIEYRKEFYGHGNEALIADCDHEIRGQVSNICKSDEIANQLMFVIRATAKLGIHNSDIANLEWQLRAGQNLPLEEQGRRAVMIRKINDGGRVRVKSDLSGMLQQNVETRHYGYGDDIKAEHLTLDVQEPFSVNLQDIPVDDGKKGAYPAYRLKRPTIEELEKILNSEEPLDIVVNPDGSLGTAPKMATGPFVHGRE